MPETCVFCGNPSEGEHTIHRDGFGVGPEVPLCNDCGGGEFPTAGEIWERIAQTADSECAYRPKVKKKGSRFKNQLKKSTAALVAATTRHVEVAE